MLGSFVHVRLTRAYGCPPGGNEVALASDAPLAPTHGQPADQGRVYERPALSKLAAVAKRLTDHYAPVGRLDTR
jgi:hypothetical protein